ncbi:hypothetical protein JST56_07115 [Candidatus Dependentiae bacterium]|nr:hypothetical protein [Candidatus Dependentiae bacterium]
MNSKIENFSKPISDTVAELIIACGYSEHIAFEDTLHYNSKCGTKKLKFSKDGFIVYQVLFEQEEDRGAEWKTMFTCSINYMIKDCDMSSLLQTVGAIDIRQTKEFREYLNAFKHGGNTGYFGLHRARA